MLAAALAVSSTAAAQQKPVTNDSVPQPATAPLGRQQLDSQLLRLRSTSDAHLPTADHFSFGDHRVPAGTTVDGPIAVARGNLEVFGTVNGDAFVIDGDIRVHRGARITGDAMATGGLVVIDGGAVDGERRSLSARRAERPNSADRKSVV